VSDPALNTNASLDRQAAMYTACALLNVALVAVVCAVFYRHRLRANGI